MTDQVVIPAESLLGGKVTLFCGDNRDVMRTLADNSIDAVASDPPYALASIVKRFGGATAAPAKGNEAFARASAGFMGQKWDTGEVAFDPEFWAEVLRVLKPGGHLVAFSGTRTYHRMACAIEDSGFEIRDSVLDMLAGSTAGAAFLASLNAEQRAAFVRLVDDGTFSGLLGWAYGSGFPKSHDQCAALDRIVAGPWCDEDELARGPVSHTAALFEAFGTALKPAWEPICLARKPLSEKSVAQNILAHGTGAINVDGCRISTADDLNGGAYAANPTARGDMWGADAGNAWKRGGAGEFAQPTGRFPANIVHDGSAEVLAAFPDSLGQQRQVGPEHGARPSVNVYGSYGAARERCLPRDDDGSAARFFYTAKADAHDRAGSKHPTVKPVDLMQWLVRLITPPGGVVLDPFAGTGTTGEAAFREGFRAVLIEREADYQADIRRRMRLALSGPDERKRESIKAKVGDQPFEAGSLFAALSEGK